jgi:hypothetical protein
VPGATHLTLADTARRAGEAIWVEERLFEVLGAWVVSDLPPATRVVLATLSRRHAWRAEQLRSRLPEVPGFAAADVVAAPDAPVADVLVGLAGADATVEDLRVVVEVVLPWLESSYAEHLELCTAVSDAAVERTLRLVLDDLTADATALGAML